MANAGSGVGEELVAPTDILFEHGQRVRDGTLNRREGEAEGGGPSGPFATLEAEELPHSGMKEDAPARQQVRATQPQQKGRIRQPARLDPTRPPETAQGSKQPSTPR